MVPGEQSARGKPRFVLEGERLRLVPLPFAARGELVAAVGNGSVTELLGEYEYWDDRHVPAFLSWSATARLLGARRAYAERDLGPLWTNTDDEPFQVTLALLEEFVRFARGVGVEKAAILVLAGEQDQARWRRDGERYWTALFDELDRRGIPYVDLSAPIGEAYRSGSEGALFQGAHHSRAGNRLIAETVRDWLAGG